MPQQAVTQTQTLPRFEEAKGLGPQDAKFVQDLAVLLEQHGNLDRFGLCLLHDHFALEDGEVLVETNDPEARTLRTQVEKADRTTHAKPSQWQFLPNAGNSSDGESGGEPYRAILLCTPSSGCPA
ncbi:hypothetical protein ACIRQP_32050 [Streptomyces sp. NPDC102274]|uniref:hypothetical protein n=1 Tax=Streptomyces sp. NPDC102274 TaxID=3366151 RepID=UPI00380FBC91